MTSSGAGVYAETLHWANARNGFESVLTVFNYYGSAFPGMDAAETDANLTVRFFTEDGVELEKYTTPVATGASVHLSVGKVHPDFRGMVAVALVPRGGMARRNAYLGRSGQPMATSYFILYEREGGFRDFSHELFLLQRKPGKVAEWATVLFLGADIRAAIVTMNNREPGSGAACESEAVIRLYDMAGQFLTGEHRYKLPPGGSCLTWLDEVFPHFDALKGRAVIATVTAPNIEQPMSLHVHASGDFNVHHF